MRFEEVQTYEELEAYLRDFNNFPGERGQYDFVRAFHLFLALLDNLAVNPSHIDDLEATDFKFTTKQTQVLHALERFRPD